MNIIIFTCFNLRVHPIFDRKVPGEDVYMGDGSIWFRPYTAATPFRVRKPIPRHTVH